MRLVSDDSADIEGICPIIPDVLLRVALCSLLATALAAAVTDRRTHTVPLPPERGISVDVTIGHVRVEGETRTDAQIDIVRTAPTKGDLARIPIDIAEGEREVRITALQVDGGTDPDLKTDVTLRVPRQALLTSIRVTEGRLTLSAFHGTVTADLRRGPIEANGISGTARLETGIGDVVASDARLSPGGLLRLRAFNGDVRLTLAERPADARIMALALNGTIRSEIPLNMRDTWGPRWGEATLGRGEPVISIDVVTGAIDIRAPG
jgi:hypothetical protein